MLTLPAILDFLMGGYHPAWGRFINADGYVNANGDILGYNMYAYCGNNPVMGVDPNGEFFISVFVGIGLAAGLLVGMSSCDSISYPIPNHIPKPNKPKHPTQEEIDRAVNAAYKAELDVVNAKDGDYQTIYINIDTDDAVSSINCYTREYYYQTLYDRTVIKANEIGIPINNLMDVNHIRWEFELHVLANYFGHPSAEITNLNIEETFWSMIRRVFQ